MYTKIEIFKTDFTDKYLLKLEDKTMYVGYIIKEIVELLQDNKPKNEIINTINTKHQINLSITELNIIIGEKIESIFTTKKSNSLIKLFKIVDPSKFNFPKFINQLFIERFFYIIFILTLIANTFSFFFVKNLISNNVFDWIVLYILILCILLIHEFGHSISAKKFNVNIKELGFGIYSIFPVFYVDLGEAWKLNIKKRTIINLSGIYTQLIIGIILIVLSLIFKSNFIILGLYHANFTIIILNFNPFFKFDGYWVVSDLLNENNLMKKSTTILKKIIVLKNPKESKILVIYSILRLCFTIWLATLIVKGLYGSITKIFLNQNVKWYDYLPIVFVTYIIYKTLKPVIKNDELERNKKRLQEKIVKCN